MSRYVRDQLDRREETIHQRHDSPGGPVVWEPQDEDPGAVFRGVRTNIGEVQVAGDEYRAVGPGASGHAIVWRISQPDVREKGARMPMLGEDLQHRPRDIGIEQEIHAAPASG